MRALMWFRNDLRVDDNTALADACERADEVVGVFLVSEGQWREHGWGDRKIAFVLRHVASLSERLATLNIALRVEACDRFDDAPEVIASIAADQDCDEVWANREYEVNERRRDDAVGERLADSGVDFRLRHDQTMLAPASVKTNEDGYYTVFTPYRRRWVDVFKSEGADARSVPKARGSMISTSDVSLIDVEDAFDESLWPLGEQAAKKRLSAFVRSRAGAYKDDRDVPGDDGTSRLSPYLAAGVISARRCLEAAIEANDGRVDDFKTGAGTWISELIWRDFYKHVLVGYPRVSKDRAFKRDTEKIEWRDDQAALEAWKEGRTGVPIVDAGMRQLAAEGWMHNRVRMITAMFLTKQLLIDWREGERHFARHLIDLDFASNNGGWQWAASTGTDAAPYFRIFNPYSQSKRYDGDGVYIKRHVPELKDVSAAALHDEDALLDGVASGYPTPIVEHGAGRERALAAFKAL